MENKAKWYVLHTFSNYESVAKENLENVVEKFNLQDRIFEIVIPMESIVRETSTGKKEVVERKVMPAYIFVKMIYGDDLWHNITRARGVTGFVGPKGRPLALTDEEVARMRLEKIYVDIDLKAGDLVEIVNGPLHGVIATVLKAEPNSDKLTVKVDMLGRENIVELDYSQIKKAK